MDFSNWIPAITTTSSLAVVMWLLRSLISTRLTKSVESEFNTKLENLKSELKIKESQIDALRSGAMSGLIGRQSLLYEKQLNAIDQLWDALTELKKYKFISSTMSIVKFEECVKKTPTDPKLRDFFKLVGGDFNMKNINTASASKARPFLTQLSWAYYNAYQSIIFLDLMKLEVLKIGLESAEKYFNLDGVSNLVKAVLPHQTNYLDKYGSSGHHHLLDEIENLLLNEIQGILKGDNSDIENTERAALIIKESDNIMESISKEKIDYNNLK